MVRFNNQISQYVSIADTSALTASETMNDLEREIIDTLDDSTNGMSAGELANALDGDPVEVEQACARLESGGAIARYRFGLPVRYTLED